MLRRKRIHQSITKNTRGKSLLEAEHSATLSFSLTKRVEDIEHISGTINKKITIVLGKLESLEDGDNKKKEHMSKLMDDFVEGNDFDDMDDM